MRKMIVGWAVLFAFAALAYLLAVEVWLGATAAYQNSHAPMVRVIVAMFGLFMPCMVFATVFAVGLVARWMITEPLE